MKVKRGKDAHWKVVKYQGDLAYYATCKCGFDYCCGNGLDRKDDITWTLYRYCPICGARKKWYNFEVIKLEQDVLDHYKKTIRCV